MGARRNAPIEWVGQVAIYAPTSKVYHRLKWEEPDGRPGDTTAGRAIEAARHKALEIDVRLGMAAGPSAVTSLETLYDLYVAEATSPYTGEPWAGSYKLQVEDNLARCLRGYEHFRAGCGFRCPSGGATTSSRCPRGPARTSGRNQSVKARPSFIDSDRRQRVGRCASPDSQRGAESA